MEGEFGRPDLRMKEWMERIGHTCDGPVTILLLLTATICEDRREFPHIAASIYYGGDGKKEDGLEDVGA